MSAVQRRRLGGKIDHCVGGAWGVCGHAALTNGIRQGGLQRRALVRRFIEREVRQTGKHVRIEKGR